MALSTGAEGHLYGDGIYDKQNLQVGDCDIVDLSLQESTMERLLHKL